MSKTAFIRARIEPQLKIDVEKILNDLGVTTTQVIHLLYRQISRDHELLPELYTPNKETARAIKEARKGKGVVHFKNADDAFKKLGI